MSDVEKNKTRVELALTRQAYLERFRHWLDDSIDKIKKFEASSTPLPEWMTKKYVENLLARRVEIEKQLLKDGEAVLDAAKSEVGS